MNIEFNCPKCGQLLAIDSKYGGTQVECPACKEPLLVPHPVNARTQEQPSPELVPSSPVPQEIRGWNWGAFLLGLPWAIGNRVWVGLLLFVPFVNIFMVFALGAKGNEWAWKTGRFTSVAQFKRVQRIWRNVGLLVLLLGILCSMLGPAVLKGREEAMKIMAESTEPTMSVEEVKSNALAIPYDDLMRENEQYIGKLVCYRGQVLQVSEIYGDKYVLRVATQQKRYGSYIGDIIWVNYKGKRLLEDDIIDVWGKVKGIRTYTAVLNHRITIPEVDSLHVELVTKAGDQ